jgi:alpha-tubulin suppressor-like RCC1 family protein
MNQSKNIFRNKYRIISLMILYFIFAVFVFSSVNCGGGGDNGDPDTTTGSVRVTVQDELGNPIEEAEVTLATATAGVSEQTNSSGVYTFTDVPAGTYTVTASKDGYVNNHDEVTVTAGQRVDVTIILLEQSTVGSIKVRVVDISAEGIKDAEVSYAGSDDLTAKRLRTQRGKGSPELTDSQGYVTFVDVPAGNYTVTASKNGYHDNQEEATVTAGVEEEIIITLQQILPTAISGGNNHSMILMSDRTVWACGDNREGQIGDGTESDWPIPVQVKASAVERRDINGFFTDVISVSGGSSHSLALKDDGTVWAWGYNSDGQLGDGTNDDSSTPVQVLAPDAEPEDPESPDKYLQNIIAISAGDYHSMALDSDGNVWAWGYNSNGQLGDNTTDDTNTPVQVQGEEGGVLSNITAISAKGYHSLALDSDGNVWAWGDNSYGQLGDETKIERHTPIKVKGFDGIDDLENIIAIAAGGYHSIALDSNGKVWAWGYNCNGQLGNGETGEEVTPIKVKGLDGEGLLEGIVAIAGGEYHSLALDSDGYVWAWGYNEDGQLGDGTTDDKDTPIKVKGLDGEGLLEGIVAITSGEYHSVALDSDGNVWSWGYNIYGQLGNGTYENTSTPVLTLTSNRQKILSVEAVSIGDYYSIALENGNVWAWGDNSYGQLGDGTNDNRYFPVQVKGLDGEGFLSDITTIAAGYYHNLALDSSGNVWAWGENNLGQVGDNDTENRNTPVQVLGEGGAGYLSDITAISAGLQFSLALDSDRNVWAWGWNEYGRLGDNTTNDRHTPVQVKGFEANGLLENIIAISAGNEHALALDSDGYVWAWGYNGNGRLGIGVDYDTINEQHTPVKVKSPDGEGVLGNIIAISAGYQHSIALDSDGNVWAWGSNFYGELGNENVEEESHTPVQVESLENIDFIAAGGNHNIAIKNGTVWTWGWNGHGQLGNNTDENSHTPVQVMGPDGVGFLQDVIAVSGSTYHSAALKSDGTVWAWGCNSEGQLGNNSVEDSHTPVQALLFERTISLARSITASGWSDIYASRNSESQKRRY